MCNKCKHSTHQNDAVWYTEVYLPITVRSMCLLLQLVNKGMETIRTALPHEMFPILQPDKHCMQDLWRHKLIGLLMAEAFACYLRLLGLA